MLTAMSIMAIDENVDELVSHEESASISASCSAKPTPSWSSVRTPDPSPSSTSNQNFDIPAESSRMEKFVAAGPMLYHTEVKFPSLSAEATMSALVERTSVYEEFACPARSAQTIFTDRELLSAVSHNFAMSQLGE